MKILLENNLFGLRNTKLISNQKYMKMVHCRKPMKYVLTRIKKITPKKFLDTYNRKINSTDVAIAMTNG